jgi:hypothetical protein
MAITYTGAVSSQIALGNDKTTQNLFAVVNGANSRHNMQIRRVIIQLDSVGALTAVMPEVRIARVTGSVSGGVSIPKFPWDTTQTSDSEINFYQTISYGNPITASPATTIWQKFDARQHTQIGQFLSNDLPLLPTIVTDEPYILRPGQNLIAYVVGPAVTSNPGISNSWFMQIAWEEDSISTFAISGTVTLSATTIEGAKVIVIEADDTVGTNPHLVEVCTTDVNGEWASTITSGRVGAAFVQYVNGGTYYTAPGSPFLEE